jgi:hypothetical protein
LLCTAKYGVVELCNGKLRVYGKFIPLGDVFIVELLASIELGAKTKTAASKETIFQVYMKKEADTGVWVFNLKLDTTKGKESVQDQTQIFYIPDGKTFILD